MAIEVKLEPLTQEERDQRLLKVNVTLAPTPTLSDGTMRLITQAIRETRNETLDAVIELCEDFERTGESLAATIRALRDLKTMLPAPPKEGN
jgi:hypothetical protein